MAIYGSIRRGAPIPYRHPPPPYNNSAGMTGMTTIPAAAATTTSPTRPFHPQHPQHPPRYFPAQSNPSAAQEFYHGYPSGSGTIPLPAKRQSTYGVPSSSSSSSSSSTSAPPTAPTAPTPPAPPPPHKDEREAPEGASSSPGLTHDVTM